MCDYIIFFFFKQKTADEMRISDWSSDVCSSDLFDRTRKVDRRQQVNSPSNSDGMILRTDGRLSKCKQRTAILASTVHEMEIVLLSLSSASPFRPSRSLFAFAYGVLLFSCHCFIKDAQFATQGGIIGFVFTVRGLEIGRAHV